MDSNVAPRPRYPFWHEVIVPTTRALEAFAWRALIGGLLLYVIFRKCCPDAVPTQPPAVEVQGQAGVSCRLEPSHLPPCP